MTKNSNRVLSATLHICKEYQGKKVVLVTNDLNLRIRAACLGIEACGYHEDVANSYEIYEPINKLPVTAEDCSDLDKYAYLSLEGTTHNYYPNQHVLVEGPRAKTLCRYRLKNNYLRKISDYSAGICGIVPRNLEQKAALDILLDAGIDIVVLSGKAGTGKTLLALAATLELMAKPEEIRKLLVSRPVIPMGKDLGFLPGDIEEKISPWMQPIFDNLEFLTTRQTRRSSKLGSYTQLREKGLVELEALTYIRGRSIPNRFMIVDEAQNLTPHEIKTIITRIGHNTKLVLTGDPFQIDNPYVDAVTNGLTYVIEKLKSYELAGHVNLFRGERSNLAELASNVL